MKIGHAHADRPRRPRNVRTIPYPIAYIAAGVGSQRRKLGSVNTMW